MGSVGNPSRRPKLIPKVYEPARLLVGGLFHDFSRKRYFSCKNGTQSRKWKGKSRNQFFTRSADGGSTRRRPLLRLPTLEVPSTWARARTHHVTSCSRPCPSCGHFQCRKAEQWALPCFFSVIAAHFLTLFVLENLSVFPSAKKWNKTQPTTGQTSYTFGMKAVIPRRSKARFDLRLGECVVSRRHY